MKKNMDAVIMEISLRKKILLLLIVMVVFCNINGYNRLQLALLVLCVGLLLIPKNIFGYNINLKGIIKKESEEDTTDEQPKGILKHQEEESDVEYTTDDEMLPDDDDDEDEKHITEDDIDRMLNGMNIDADLDKEDE